MGDGGKPPPGNTVDLLPPHEFPFVPAIAPDPLNRFTKYPRASPSALPQDSADVGTGRFVLNVTRPAAISAEVTPCSPGPFSFRLKNQPRFALSASSDVDVQVVVDESVELMKVEPSISIAPELAVKSSL
jgi:hypothetical protein